VKTIIQKLLLTTFLLSLSLFSYAQNIELPEYDASDTVIHHTGYSLSYSEEHEQAEWVAYELTVEELRGNVERTDNFRADPNVDTETASLSDYRGSGYDRGHLAPAADFSWSKKAMSDTFYFSNMSPQKPGFNRGIWRSLESQVREWAVRDRALLVVTGPVLRDVEYKTIGENDVAIPRYYYKVLLDIEEPELKGIGFLLPHESSSAPLSSFAVSIDKVEQITGIDFYHAIEDDLEERLESSFNGSLWFDGENYSVEKQEVEQNVERQAAPARYWINGNKRHNSDCRYYGNTKDGYYTDEKVGDACGVCGG